MLCGMAKPPCGLWMRKGSELSVLVAASHGDLEAALAGDFV